MNVAVSNAPTIAWPFGARQCSNGHTRHHPRNLPHPRACSRTHHHTNHANNPSPATPDSAALTVHIPSPSAAPSVRPAAPRAYSKNKENLAQFSSHAAHSKPSVSTNANATTDDARRLRYALSPRVEKIASNDPMSPWAVSSKLCPGSDDGFGETIAEWTQGSERRETSGPQVSRVSRVESSRVESSRVESGACIMKGWWGIK